MTKYDYCGTAFMVLLFTGIFTAFMFTGMAMVVHHYDKLHGNAFSVAGAVGFILVGLSYFILCGDNWARITAICCLLILICALSPTIANNEDLIIFIIPVLEVVFLVSKPVANSFR